MISDSDHKDQEKTGKSVETPKAKPDRMVDARTGKELTAAEIAKGGYIKINRKQRKKMEALQRRANKHRRPEVQTMQTIEVPAAVTGEVTK